MKHAEQGKFRFKFYGLKRVQLVHSLRINVKNNTLRLEIWHNKPVGRGREAEREG